MPSINLTDDNLLRLNAAAFGVHGAWALAHPTTYHDTCYGAGTPRSDVKDRWHGLAVLGFAAQNIAAAEGNGVGARDVKKNALLAAGATATAGALLQGYNISSGKCKNDALNVANVGALAGLAVLNFWKGAGGKDKKAKATVK